MNLKILSCFMASMFFLLDLQGNSIRNHFKRKKMTKILIADDEEIVIKAMLKTFSKYGKCTTVLSGKDAIDSFTEAMDSEHPFNLIILDISMKDTSGIEVLKEIRRMEKEKGIEKKNQTIIIMGTSNRTKKVVQECIAAGCNKYLLKPLKPDSVATILSDLGIDSIECDESEKKETSKENDQESQGEKEDSKESEAK